MALTRQRKFVIAFVVGGLTLAGTLGLLAVARIAHTFSGESGTPSNVPSAIATTLKWGRLAPLPAAATEVAITTEGSMFSRSFQCTFVASATDIERWLQASPGTTAVTPTTAAPDIRRFQIVPGGGAQFAEVFVDDVAHRVRIITHWS